MAVTRADLTWRGPRLGILALLLAFPLAGCSADSSGASDAASPAGSSRPADPATGPAIDTYVALGDSFTAAPLVPSTDVAGGCFRSTGNYPARVAEELGAKLRDVSCGGADTADIAGRQEVEFNGRANRVPPQLKAVRPGVDLVTVGIGGNDEGLFAALVRDCTAVARTRRASCAAVVRDSVGDPADVFDRVGRRVTGVLEDVQRKAPDAEVVLVGYPRLVDVDRPCRLIPLAASEVPVVAELEAQLNRTLAGAARAARAEYVDMYTASEGHEICSADPWVNGRVTDQQRALSYHPFAEGQQAVADELLALLERPSP